MTEEFSDQNLSFQIN